jgi:hypothetical protein
MYKTSEHKRITAARPWESKPNDNFWYSKSKRKETWIF